MTTKQTEALSVENTLKLALEAICGSGEFLFNWHDCEPNNEREIQSYQATLADNEKAFTAIREALAEQPAQQRHISYVCPQCYWSLEEQPAQPKGCQCPACKVTPHASDCAVHNEPAYQKGSCDCGAQQWNAGVPSLYPEPEPGVSIKATYEQPAQQQEPVAWRNAALRVGEDLCSVGPFGYYDMTAEQWLDWALSVVTVHAPPASKPWVRLTDEEILSIARNHYNPHERSEISFARAIEAKLKEKNA